MVNDRVFLVDGPPGTGKTTYLVRQAQRALDTHGNDRVVIASLTRTASREIAGRGLEIPDNHVGTLHSLCYQSLGKPDIAELHIDEWNKEHPDDQIVNDFAGTDETVDQRTVRSDQNAAWKLEALNVYRAQMMDRDHYPDRYVQNFADEWFDWMQGNDLIDFTGMIEQCLEHTDCAPDRPDVLIGDEAQDWSKLEATLFRDHWGKKAETVIMAGDPDQTIYDWRGADPKIFSGFQVPPENRIVLEQSYRLPRAPHAKALHWIRQIKDREDVVYHARDAEGAVEISEANYLEPDVMVDAIQDDLSNGKSVMVLATCAYMLDTTVKRLRAHAIPFHNPFRVKNGAWNPLATRRNATMPVDRVKAFLRPDGDTYGDDCRLWDGSDLHKWMTVMRAKADRKTHDRPVLARGVISTLNDKETRSMPPMPDFINMFTDPNDADCAMECNLEWYKAALKGDFKRKMEFPIRIAQAHGGKALMTTPRVVVGTIHSVKGGEADSVYLFPDVSARAGDGLSDADAWDSMVRLFYVGMTRTKEKLTICNDATNRGGFIQ